MTKILVLILTAIFGIAHAAPPPVSLDFESIPLPSLARLVIQEIGKQGFAFAPAFDEHPKRVSLRVVRSEPRAVAEMVFRMIEAEGFAVERGPVVWIDKPTAQRDLIYRPVARSAAYLAERVAPLFKPGAVALQQTSAPGGVVAGEPRAESALTQAGADVPPSSGDVLDVLVFRGLLADVARMEALVRQLDVAAPELLVKAIVFEVSKSSTDRSALSLAGALLGDRLRIDTGNVRAGDWSAVFKSATLTAVYDALSSDGRFRVVSQPQMRVTSGSSAKLTVGTQTPVISGTQTDRNGNVVQRVEYKPSGVILDLKPEVREAVLQMQVDQQISHFQQTTTGVNNTPTLVTRHLQTVVTMAPGELLVLGGLNERKGQNTSSGLPFLPSWLGARSETQEDTEVLVFLHAQRL